MISTALSDERRWQKGGLDWPWPSSGNLGGKGALGPGSQRARAIRPTRASEAWPRAARSTGSGLAGDVLNNRRGAGCA